MEGEDHGGVVRYTAPLLDAELPNLSRESDFQPEADIHYNNHRRLDYTQPRQSEAGRRDP